jgi:hypothetical protein
MNTPQNTPGQEAGRGVTILVFGILSIVALGPILGIPAWVMGRTDLSKIRAGLMPESERQLTKAGMILGIIGTFYFIVAIVIVVIVLLVYGVR